MDAPSECACGCGLITWPGKIKPATDVMLRPTPPSPALRDSSKSSLALIPSHPHYHDKGKGKAVMRADESLYALSTRLAESVSEYFDFRTVTAVVVRDVQELLDALDELVHAIGRQTAFAWEQSKGTALGLKAQIQRKHERARARALELRQMGGRLLESVQERVRGRTSAAKDNAKAVRQSAWSVDVWNPVPGMKKEPSSPPSVCREKVRKASKRARLSLKH